MTAYDAAFWQSKISDYTQEDWSHNPSPFALLVQQYLQPSSQVLELGTGAGQDALWFSKSGHTVTATDGEPSQLENIQKASGGNVKTEQFNLLDGMPFSDESFDAVYAQLVLHYFTNEEMAAIMAEIERVLKPQGVFACLLNSIHDPEFSAAESDDQDMIYGKIAKRYFSKASFTPFVEDFVPLIFDEEGTTPKDEAIGTGNLVRFIGKKV